MQPEDQLELHSEAASLSLAKEPSYSKCNELTDCATGP